MTRVTAVPTATGTRPVSRLAFPSANVTSMRCSAAPGDVLELLAAVGAEAEVGAEVDVAAEEPAAFPAQPVSGATRISRPARAGRRWAGRIDTGRLRGVGREAWVSDWPARSGRGRWRRPVMPGTARRTGHWHPPGASTGPHPS